MASANQGLVLESFKGGMNDQDAPNAIGLDQVVLAQNVEFFNAPLGERRGGMEPIDLGTSAIASKDTIVHMNTHLPKQELVKDSQLFVFGASEGASMALSYRDKNFAWHDVSIPNTPVTTFPTALKISSQSIHGKLYVMYRSAVDRAHVWDGSTLRRIGVAPPTGTPTAADNGSGSLTGQRLYRLRAIVKVSGVTTLRSEPSDEVDFTPSGTGSGVLVDWSGLTAPGDGETHWELEASSGDGNFYILTTLTLATTSYTDTTADPTDFAVGELSADIGDYEVVPSYKFVKADQDRLIFANQWEDDEKGSRVAWTPVWKATGVGNDERIPADTDNFFDLDWSDGGDITGISDPLNGSFYVFKYQRIYKVQRTGRADQAYEPFLVSTAHGAVEGSVISGIDEFGRGCVYFLDPATGPMRVGTGGVQYLKNIRGTWRRMNVSAANIFAHGVYYPDKQQVLWWLSVDGADTPNIRLRLQVSEVRSDDDSTQRGWSIDTGDITEAYCSTIVPQLVDDESAGSVVLASIPYAGFNGANKVQVTDVNSTDNGATFQARIVTRPYLVAGLLNRWGAMTAALLAQPNSDATVTIDVKCIRDFGKETNFVNTDFVPDSTETSVIKVFDNLRMSEAKSIQFEFADPA